MSTQEYKCEKCRMEFNEQGTCGPQPTSDAKCPMCGSTDVRELNDSERLFKKALGSMRGG